MDVFRGMLHDQINRRFQETMARLPNGLQGDVYPFMVYDTFIDQQE